VWRCYVTDSYSVFVKSLPTSTNWKRSVEGKPIILITTYSPSDCCDTETLHLSLFEYYQQFWNQFITDNGRGILSLTVLRTENLFHLSFCVSNQNISMWSTENSHPLWRNIARPEVDVWRAMSWIRIILPIFFWEIFNVSVPPCFHLLPNHIAFEWGSV